MSLASWLSYLNLALLIIASLVIKKYLPSYFAEKGKNLATRQDIEDITRKVESVKAQLEQEGRMLEERRRVYARIAESLRIFISGGEAGDEKQQEFLAAYASAWLWAPDDVVQGLSHFLDLQIQHAADSKGVAQNDMKAAYASILLEMRRDVGHLETKITVNDYKFVSF